MTTHGRNVQEGALACSCNMLTLEKQSAQHPVQQQGPATVKHQSEAEHVRFEFYHKGLVEQDRHVHRFWPGAGPPPPILLHCGVRVRAAYGNINQKALAKCHRKACLSSK